MTRWMAIILVSTAGFFDAVAQGRLNLNASHASAPDNAFHNPAGMSFASSMQGTVATQWLYAGLAGDDLRNNWASFVYPLDGERALGLRGWYFTADILQQGAFSFLFSQKLLAERLSLGVNANLLTYSYDRDKFKGFDPNDPVLAKGTSKQAFSYGLGLLFQPVWWLALGASVDHLNRPDISLGNSGFKKHPIYKMGISLQHAEFTPQLEVKIEPHDLFVQAGLRRSFLDHKLELFAGYDFEEIFAEASFRHGQFGLSYNYQYPLTDLNEIASGSHRLSLLFNRGGYAPPVIALENADAAVVGTPATRVTGKVSHREGIAKIEVWRNGKRMKELRYRQKPQEVELAVEVPLEVGKNEISIVAYGGQRRRSQKLWVTLAPPVVPPANLPAITILSAEESRLLSGIVKTKAKTVRLQYKVTKVDSLADVQIKVNKNRLETRDLRVLEKIENGFTLWQDVDLNEGLNLIEVRASNEVGSKNAELKIFYNPLLDTLLYRKTWAIIIGIDKYRDPKIEALNFAVRDAMGVEKMLREKFKFDHFITLHNEDATNDRIIAALSDSLQKADPEDGVFVFFAGHGFTVVTARGDTIGGIVPYDGASGVYAPNISMEQIKDTARLVNAKHIFYVMDACYSGALLVKTRSTSNLNATLSSRIKEFVSKPARDVLTAGQQGEEVLDGGRNNHSIFTGWLLEGLEGVADADQDSYVTANELSRYVHENVIKDAKIHRIRQTPQFGKLTTDNGEFVFVPK